MLQVRLSVFRVNLGHQECQQSELALLRGIMCAKNIFPTPLHHHRQHVSSTSGKMNAWIHAVHTSAHPNKKQDSLDQATFFPLSNGPRLVTMSPVAFTASCFAYRSGKVFCCCSPSTWRCDELWFSDALGHTAIVPTCILVACLLTWMHLLWTLSSVSLFLPAGQKLKLRFVHPSVLCKLSQRLKLAHMAPAIIPHSKLQRLCLSHSDSANPSNLPIKKHFLRTNCTASMITS